MARKVTVTLTDDLDDSQEADETVSFAIDGVEFEIDLSTKNAEKLRKAVNPFAEAGRRVGGRKQRGRATVAPARTSIDREQSNAMRQWARDNGYSVSDRGRISQEIQEAFQAAH